MNVMDIETLSCEKTGRVIPYCICLRLDNEYFSFWYDDNKNLVISFLENITEFSKNNTVEIFTHNINFDGFVIIDAIKDTGIYYDLYIKDYNLYWISIIFLKIKILIRCSYKIIPISVYSMGLMLGFPKGVFPYKFSSISNLTYIGPIPSSDYFNSYDDYVYFCDNNKFFDFKKTSIDYCLRDIEIVYKVLKEVIYIINFYGPNLIKNSFSFSSIAYKIYVRKYDKWDVDKIKNNKFSHQYIKESYYGGRCEVFGNPCSGKKVHYFDFSGMYSQCMLQKFPIGPGRFIINNLDVKKIGFHAIKFSCDNYLPFLPYRVDKLMFCNGVMSGVFWYEEILNAIEHNRCNILDHYSSFVYEQEDYIFKEYSDFFSSIREKGLFYKIFGKNMNNGLYGSFALNEKDEDYVICHNDVEFRTYIEQIDVLSFTKIGNSYIIKVKKSDRNKKFLDKKGSWKSYKKRNIAYASIISSKARIKLNNSLDAVLKSGGELYYTDTDSIFAGYDENNLGKQVGEVTWSNVFDEAVFITSKFYYIKGNNVKLKGINNIAYDYDYIKNSFYDNNDSIVFTDQINFNRNNFLVLQKNLNKKISLNSYSKRIFSFDKKQTFPHKFSPDL